MTLRFRNLRFAISAHFVVLFLTVGSAAAQEGSNNPPRTELAAKAKAGESGITTIAVEDKAQALGPDFDHRGCCFAEGEDKVWRSARRASAGFHRQR